MKHQNPKEHRSNKNILALDIGTQFIGLARAASNGLCVPLKTIRRAQNQAQKQILQLLEDEQIDLIVVGIPLNEDGSENPQCDDVRNYCRRLAKRTTVPIEFVDEYASTTEAQELLSTKRATQKQLKHSGQLDAASAAIILQKYLELSGS